MTIKLKSNLYVGPVNIYPNFWHCMLLYAQCCSVLFCCVYIICFWWIHSICLPMFFRVASLAVVHTIDPIHKSHNAPVPYPTMHQSCISQCTISQCTHFCSDWYIVGYGTSALWDFLDLSIAPVSVYVLLPQCQRINPEGYGLILTPTTTKHTDHKPCAYFLGCTHDIST